MQTTYHYYWQINRMVYTYDTYNKLVKYVSRVVLKDQNKVHNFYQDVLLQKTFLL